MLLRMFQGKTYTEEEWKEKVERDREEERQKVPEYNEVCKKISTLQETSIKQKLKTLTQFGCDEGIKSIFNSVEYLILQAQCCQKPMILKDS